MNLETVSNTVTMSSLEIADLTGKSHTNVMRDIRNMVEQLQKSNLSSVCNSGTYKSSIGQSYPMYELDKDTCLTLLLGYDAVARMKVVKRWQELEQQITRASLPDFTNPVIAARAWADEVEGRLIAEKKVEEAQPAIGFYDAVGDSTALTSVGDAAKSFGFGRNNFFKWLICVIHRHCFN